ncbi:MAG: cell wall-binding repeat-containing protein [Firmicutes bacterium]|nr:cell wall-binding repeat-containing protein [Bacillota bacterium]
MATAIAIANAQYPNGPSSGIVILASGANANLIDSVTAAPLAKALGAPILLSQDQNTLGSETMNYLTSHNITKVYLIGAAANPTLASQLPAGVTTVNVTGADRYATAAQIAQQLAQAEGKSSFSTVYVASGDDPDLSDALAIAPWAAAAGDPVLLAAPGQTSLPSSEASFVTGSSSQTEVVVGTAVGYNLSAGGDTQKTIGSGSNDNYANAVAIAQAMAPSSGYTTVDIANDSSTDVVNANGMISYHLVDAITGGPYAASQGAPILFTNGANIPSSVQSFLTSSLVKSVGTVQVFGGTASIPSSTVSQILNTISGATTPTQSAVGSLTKIKVSGQAFGDGSVTNPAVAQNGAPLTVSSTLLDPNGNPVPGVNVQLYFTAGAPVVSSVTQNGEQLTEASGANGWFYFNVPTDANGVASAQLSESGGTSLSTQVQFWGPYISNGVQITSNKAYLEFVGTSGLAVSPASTAKQGFPTGSAVPVVVTLPLLNGQEPVNAPVCFQITAPTNSPAFFANSSGGQVATNTSGSCAGGLVVYTNTQGQATAYVSSESNVNNVTVSVTATDAAGTFTGSTVFSFGQQGIPLSVHNFGVAGASGTLAGGFTAQVGSDVTFYAQAVDSNGNPVPNAQLIVVAGGNGNNTDSYIQNGSTTPFPYVISAGSTLSGSPAAGSSVGELITANAGGFFQFTVTNSTATGSTNPNTNVTAKPNNYLVYPVENGTVDTTDASSGIISAPGSPEPGITVTWTVSGNLTSIGVQGVPSVKSTDTSVTGIQAQSVPASSTTSSSFTPASSQVAILYVEGFSGALPYPTSQTNSSGGAETINVSSTGNASLYSVDGAPLSSSGYQVNKSGQVGVSFSNSTYTITAGGKTLGTIYAPTTQFTIPSSGPAPTSATITFPSGSPSPGNSTTVYVLDQTGAVVTTFTNSVSTSNGQYVVTFNPSSLSLNPGTYTALAEVVAGSSGFQVPVPAQPEMVQLGFTDTSAESATVTLSSGNVSSSASITFTSALQQGNGQLGATNPVSTTLNIGQSSTITFTVQDANGNPVPNLTVNFTYANMPDLWITAVNGVTLQSQEYSPTSNSQATEPTPLPLFTPGSSGSGVTSSNPLGYNQVVIPGVVTATFNNGTPSISFQTNSQGQVTLTLSDGASYYEGYNNGFQVTSDLSSAASPVQTQTAYFGFLGGSQSVPSGLLASNGPNGAIVLSQTQVTSSVEGSVTWLW